MDSGKLLSSHVNTIAVHRTAHNDELLAVWMIKTFGGESAFPGANRATVVFLDAVPSGETWETLLEKQRMLLVGMGNSPFDEHLAEGGRKPDQCAATLVADVLDLREDEALKPLLDFTLARDTNVGKNAYEIPQVIKALWNSGGDDAEKEQLAVNWAFAAYDALYECGLNFATRTAGDYQKAQKIVFWDAATRRIELVYGHSNSPDFGKYARYKKASIVVWMKDEGNAIIQTNHRLKIDLGPVVRAIRIAEICEVYRNNPKAAPFPLPLGYASSEGSIAECPYWYYHAAGRQFMNGSQGHAALPTRLSLDRLANIIKAVLGRNCTLERISQESKPLKKSFHQRPKGPQPSRRPEVVVDESPLKTTEISG